jgi:hypothetical protein
MYQQTGNLVFIFFFVLFLRFSYLPYLVKNPLLLG